MAELNLREEVILVIGNMGGDAGYSVLTPHGIVHVPGNNPMVQQAFQALMNNFKILQEAALKQANVAGPGDPGAMGHPGATVTPGA